MNQITKWNPFRELDVIQNRISSLLGRQWRTENEQSGMITEWTPLVDVTEDQTEYLIKAELPEVRKEDVKVTVDEGTLRIRGERKFEQEQEGKTWHRVERAYGTFERSFALPEGARGDQVSADFKEGVLIVHLPKSEQAKSQPREIEIS